MAEHAHTTTHASPQKKRRRPRPLSSSIAATNILAFPTRHKNPFAEHHPEVQAVIRDNQGWWRPAGRPKADRARPTCTAWRPFTPSCAARRPAIDPAVATRSWA